MIVLIHGSFTGWKNINILWHGLSGHLSGPVKLKISWSGHHLISLHVPIKQCPLSFKITSQERRLEQRFCVVIYAEQDLRFDGLWETTMKVTDYTKQMSGATVASFFLLYVQPFGSSSSGLQKQMLHLTVDWHRELIKKCIITEPSLAYCFISV